MVSLSNAIKLDSRRKLALYDYDPTQLSPNVDSEVELSFRAGDILVVFGEMDDDGFFIGELNGRRGLVPSNFLTDVPQNHFFRAPETKNLVQVNGGSNGLSFQQQPRLSNGAGSALSRNGNVQPRVLGQQRRW